jgi:adenylate kinase family enzyme
MYFVYIINGPGGSGKTTFGELVGKYLEKKQIPFAHESSIDPVKKYLRTYGWEGKVWEEGIKDNHWREVMYLCKCEFIRKDKHCLDKYCVERIEKHFKNFKCGVLFFDVREPENIEQLKSFLKKSIIKI